jgi:hypothetical protein
MSGNERNTARLARAKAAYSAPTLVKGPNLSAVTATPVQISGLSEGP